MIPERPDHPSHRELEMHHVREASDEVVQHVRTCPRCSAIARRLDEHRQHFLAAQGSDDFMRALQVLAIQQSKPMERASPSAFPSRKGSWIAYANAAVVLLVVVAIGKAWNDRRPEGDTAASIVTKEQFVQPSESIPLPVPDEDLIERGGAGAPLPTPLVASEPDIGVSLIRKREGTQTLLRDTVGITAGDELRAVLHLQQGGRVGAAIRMDDGAWVPFFEAAFAEGVHTPGATLQVDAQPGSGRLLVGTPEALERARSSGDDSGLVGVRLEWRAAR